MTMQVRFKPGAEQSVQAARYFSDTASALMEDRLESMAQHSILMALPDGQVLELRIWSETVLEGEKQHGMLGLIGLLRDDALRLVEEPASVDDVGRIVADWMRPMAIPSMFLELHRMDGGGSAMEHPLMALGILEGRLVMLSTEHLMFVQLHPGIHGLSLAGQGSFLLEATVADGGMGLKQAS